MYLHLGDDTVISGDRLIAILNMEDPVSPDLIEIIENAQLERRLSNISLKDKNKSLVVCNDKLYLSPISSNTLFKRAIYFRREG
ncbi:MAG: extracellular matrix/biofilm biosynthesis regulator RemA family protein [Syntrophomonas sp.]